MNKSWATIFGREWQFLVPDVGPPKYHEVEIKKRIVYWAIGILILQLNVISNGGRAPCTLNLQVLLVLREAHIHVRVHNHHCHNPWWMVNRYDFFGSVACLAFWGRGSFKSSGLPADGDALEAGAGGWRVGGVNVIQWYLHESILPSTLQLVMLVTMCGHDSFRSGRETLPGRNQDF